MAKRWESKQIYGKASAYGVTPCNKETMQKFNGIVVGVGEAKPASKAGGLVVTVAVQVEKEVNGKWCKTFSVSNRKPKDEEDKAKREAWRKKMLESGAIEMDPVFVKIKYEPTAVDVKALLDEMRNTKDEKGRPISRYISGSMSTVVDRNADKTPKMTKDNQPIQNNFAVSVFLSCPEGNEPEFDKIYKKNVHVEFPRAEAKKSDVSLEETDFMKGFHAEEEALKNAPETVAVAQDDPAEDEVEIPF